MCQSGADDPRCQAQPVTLRNISLGESRGRCPTGSRIAVGSLPEPAYFGPYLGASVQIMRRP